MKSILAATGAALLLSTVAAYAVAKDLAAEFNTTETHAGLAAKATSMESVKMHLHHALNCMVGVNGNGYNVEAGNPCQKDGDGLLVDIKDKPLLIIELHVALGHLRAGVAATDMAAAQKAAADAQAVIAANKPK